VGWQLHQPQGTRASRGPWLSPILGSLSWVPSMLCYPCVAGAGGAGGAASPLSTQEQLERGAACRGGVGPS
jgi:hypothetical protein